MALVVKKFGGTSVGDVARIKNVALLIQRYLKDHPGDKVVVVVSAMAGETNKLVALGKSMCSEPDAREMDVLLTTGEQITIALLSMALIELGIPAKSLVGSQAKISTNKSFTRAQIEHIEAKSLEDTIAAGKIPVVAGFQGVTEEGDLTTLGRGGSDITAVAIAAALKADACYIYTDVEGVYSADPRVVPNAKQLPKVCHEEMLEMASLGAKVLHHRSVYFAMRYQVPLVVLSTFNPTRGTWIVKEEELMEKPVVTGVTHRSDEAKITVRRLPKRIDSINQIFQALAGKEIFVDMITQTSVTDGLTDISFTVPDDVSSQALRLIQDAIPKLGAEGASLDRDIAQVSVVGVGMKYHTGVAARMFAALAAERIDVEMISTSESKISVVIARKYCEVAVRTLHDAFIDLRPQVSEEVDTSVGAKAA